MKKITLRHTVKIAKPVTTDDLAEYHRKVESFDSQLSGMWRTIALFGIGVGAVGMISCAVAAQSFARLFPLKEVKWQMVYKDQSHGDFAPAESIDRAVEKFNDADTSHWLGKYVHAREEWIYDDRYLNFEQVTLMSDDSEQKAYADWFNPPSPTAPQKIYGMDNKVRVLDRYFSIRQQWKRGFHLGFVEWHWCRQVQDRTNRITYQPWVSSFNYDWNPDAIPSKLVIGGRTVNARNLNYVGLIVSGYRTQAEGRETTSVCMGAS